MSEGCGICTSGDGRGESGLAVVHMTNGTNVHMRLVSGKYSVRVPSCQRGGGGGNQNPRTQRLLLQYVKEREEGGVHVEGDATDLLSGGS